MVTNGKLPITGMIELPMDVATWSQIENKLVNQCSIEAFIKISEGRKAKVQIVVEQAYSREGILARNFNDSQNILTTFEEDIAISLIRAYNTLANAVIEISWCLIGYTTNGTSKVLICIVAIPEFGYATYSLSKPKPINPTLN